MKKYFYYILLIINFISIIFCSLNLKDIKNELVLFPLCIITCFEIFMILKQKTIIELKIDKQKIVFSTILCIIFLTMLPILSVLNKLTLFQNTIIVNMFFKIVFFLSLFFSLFVIFGLIFSYESKINDTKKTKNIVMIIITVISLLFIGSTSTGFYDTDFPDIWNYHNNWSNWHTFGFAFLVYFCKILFNSPYLIIIMNLILYLYFCNYALKILERQTKNKHILILFLLINIFTLVGFDQLRYILKDTLFSFGFCILILTFIDYFILNKFTKRIVINLIIFSVITVLFRHGALYLLMIIYFIFLIIILIKKQYIGILYIGISVLSFYGLHSIINYIGLDVLKAGIFPESVTYTVPIYQVGAFANDGYVFDDESKEYLERYLPVDYMAENFEKYNGDALARIGSIPHELHNFYTFDYSGLVKINYNLFIDRPIFYVRSLLDLTNILWKIERDNSEWLAYFYKYEWEYEYNQYLKNITIPYKGTILNKVVEPIIEIGLKKFLFDIRVKGAIPLFMLILSSLLFICKKKYKYLIPISFIFIWYMLLFLSLPVGFTRYVLPFINIYPFIFCLALGTKKAT